MATIKRTDPIWENQVAQRIQEEFGIQVGEQFAGISDDGFSVDVSESGAAVASVTLMFSTDRTQVDRIFRPAERPQEAEDEEAMARAQAKLFGPPQPATEPQEPAQVRASEWDITRHMEKQGCTRRDAISYFEELGYDVSEVE